ncbi:MAG: nicotinate-nucleotide--dimethylbenzimidazole phosphoribosyltransferase [Desulforhopalus sp.]
MQLSLIECGKMEYRENVPDPEDVEDRVTLAVSYCAICRTDAKMWRGGHRDLVLPRVLGHEIAGVDETTGKLYTVWPGQVCGKCRYCTSGRQNLCDEMRIIGFHGDGGFARYVSVPRQSLIEVSDSIDPSLVTFAEPVGCVLNGISRLDIQSEERVIIYGGGVLGVLAALVFREKNCRVTLIEKNQEKIATLTSICALNTIELCKDTRQADFDVAMNCCDSHIAFSLCITKLRKGGRLAFFSGLEKNEELDTNLLNLVHYKEIEVYGSYGPRRDHMVDAIPFCTRQQENLHMLVEKIIAPQEVEGVLAKILDGTELKYIVDFGSAVTQPADNGKLIDGQQEQLQSGKTRLSVFLNDLTARIEPGGAAIRDQAQQKVDLKTKPLGALGKIEDLAVKVSVIKNNLDPTVDCRRIFVFAGDHGVVEEGVSAFPAKVTVQMVENFLNGGAAINAFCNQYQIELAVVDMGVNGDFADHPLLIKKKVARGTNNFAVQKAMSMEQTLLAIEHGARCFLEKNEQARCDLVGMGEMGIGNTSSATAIICSAAGMSVEDVIGRGTGIDDSGLERKREVLEKALALHRPIATDGLDLLSKVGGYEIAGICGAVLAAASEGCCVVLDGIISTAGGLIAYLLCPEIQDYLIAGHKSVETGQQAALDIMGLEPVLDLDLRLGEGTGAAITMNLVDLACRMMREMASFDEAGISRE